MTDQVNEAVTNLYHAVNAMLLVVGRDGEIDSRHESTAAVMQALRAIDGGQYNPELQIQATHPSRGVVDEAMVERAHFAFISYDGDVRNSLRAALQAAALPAVPEVPEWTAVLDALDAVNEAANDARHRGEYGKANKLVNARVTLYRAALANEEAATPNDQPAQGVG